MKTLESMINELSAAQATAAIDIEEKPASVRGGWATRVREAKDAVVTLRKEYSEALLKSSVAIFLDGAPEKIAKATEVFTANNGLIVDANALYDRFTKVIEPTMSEGRSWGVAQTFRLNVAIQEIMHEVGVNEMDRPTPGNPPALPTADDTRKYVKSLIQGAVGDNLARLYLAKSVVDRAVEIRYTGVTVPVLVLGATPDEAANLTLNFGKGVTTLKLDDLDEVTEESLSKLLKAAGKKVKK